LYLYIKREAFGLQHNENRNKTDGISRREQHWLIYL